MNTQMRVRTVLDEIGSNSRRALVKYLPEYVLPANTSGAFPHAILASFPSDHKYSQVGILTEKLVLSEQEPTIQSIVAEMTHVDVGQARAKIALSKTTADYLQKILATRESIRNALPVGYDLGMCVEGAEYVGKNIMGHPDGVFGTTVVAEVKTTSKLDVEHTYFMLQLCLYMALNPEFSRGILVLPLQSTCIVINDWPNRKLLLEEVEKRAEKLIAKRPPTVSIEDIFGVANLVDYYRIGRHVNKNKTLLNTVCGMVPGVPFQIFLSSNVSSKLNIDEADLTAAAEWVRNNNIILYIHAPYIINLAAEYEDEWNIQYMCKTMKYAARLGAKGVVVHVGKFTTQDIDVAEEYMAYAVQTILEQTDPACPLLIETPAGQGSEMFCTADTFCKFIQLFGSPKLKVCVDTCHVFATGYKPSVYLMKVVESGVALQLVHYNDSNEICGSCKDRHAPVGRGHIGIAEMTAVADFCGANGIHMVIE